MRATLAVRGIVAYGRHGVTSDEREAVQPFEIDISVDVELGNPESDDLASTLDYAKLHERVVTTVRERSFALLERLAYELSRELLTDARVVAATVTISKPGILGGATPSVTIHRPEVE